MVTALRIAFLTTNDCQYFLMKRLERHHTLIHTLIGNTSQKQRFSFGYAGKERGDRPLPESLGTNYENEQCSVKKLYKLPTLLLTVQPRGAVLCGILWDYDAAQRLFSNSEAPLLAGGVPVFLRGSQFLGASE